MDNKTIKAVFLEFENCEVAEINPQFIDDFALQGITSDKCLAVDPQGNKSFVDCLRVSETFMRILPSADVPFIGLAGKKEETVFQRIAHWNDICGITVEYEDGTQEHYLPFYEEESSDIAAKNLAQFQWKDQIGNLWLYIGKDFKHLRNYKDISFNYKRRENKQ